MYTISLIKRHIFSLPQHKIFTTRDMLIYGTRTAVDQTLAKLVKQEVIVRLARGVFTRDGSHIRDLPIYEIARAKAESFGRKIAPYAGNLAFNLGFSAASAGDDVLAIDGSSTSFMCRGTRIYMRKTCQRKMVLTRTETGKLLAALWHAGKDAFKVCERSLPWFDRKQKEEIRHCATWLPSWLAAPFLPWCLSHIVLRRLSSAASC